ncbi:MAG: hypothetical protein JNJ54_03675 [Myxococcaceae bacterium]|nr:hypothetical protein [Myxococcaceae bacterium]
MNRSGLAALLALLTSCFRPVDSIEDAGAPMGDGGAPVCTVGLNQTCNELATMSSFAGVCFDSGCVCNPGFEKAPSGRCQPQRQGDAGTCAGTGPACLTGVPGGECGDAALPSTCVAGQWACPQGTIPSTMCACVGRPAGACTCTSTGWSCPDAGNCTGAPPTGFGELCVSGTPGGACGDALQSRVCSGTQWVCPANTIPTTQCACIGRPPGNCTCTAMGWSCADAGPTACTPGVAMSCNDGPLDGGIGGLAGTCTAAGTCVCNLGFQVNPATGRCRPQGPPVCTGTGMTQACNELQGMASFAGQCVNGQCVCNTGFEPAPSGRCQPVGAICTDRVSTSCNDELTDGGVAGFCAAGTCGCNAGFAVNPATGRCRAVRPQRSCTVGMDQTCNADPLMSAVAGTCVAGTCSCSAGFALTPEGTCTPSVLGYCVANNGMGTCRIETFDGGVAAGGLCGNQALAAACVCEPGTPPTPRCMGLCPPLAGRTCVTTNCGTVSCLPPLRCIGTNVCAP